MALQVKTIANKLLGFAAEDWTVTTSPLPSSLLQTVADTITGAEQEMRSLNPGLFSTPREKRLAAPASITPTIATSGTTFTAGTGIPGAGCTLLLDGNTGGYNRVLAMTSVTAGSLVRTHAGGDGATTGTVWDDAWVVADGVSWELLLGEVRLDGKPLVDARSEAGMARLYNERRGVATDYGRNSSGSGLFDALTPVAGTPLYYWTEWTQTVIGEAPQQRLRLFPMPSAAATLAARVVWRPADVTAADLALTTRTVSAPAGKEQELFMPLVLWHWAQTPFYKPDGNQMRTLTTRYAAAQEALKYFDA